MPAAHTYAFRTSLTDNPVSEHPNLPTSTSRTAHTYAHHLQRLAQPPRPLHNPPFSLNIYDPPPTHSTYRNRQPRKLRPPSTYLRQHRPTQPAHTSPHNVHLCRHRATTHMEQHACYSMRTLRQGLGAVDIPPSYSKSSACAREEEGLAYRR